ncbi:hypothetical protein DB346_19275 [Verrucomicrobia bacterium LW23]|nr:hypothetical protein DB346_19275 [Verrucomicrobia bacterium LW23]
MKNYFYYLRRARKANKSQSLVEFAMILPVYLSLMCGVFDYGWFIGNKTLLTMSVATAVQVGARSEDAMATTMTNMYEIMITAPWPRLKMNTASGAGVITFLIRPTAGSNFLRTNGDPEAAVGSFGGFKGSPDETKNASRLLYAGAGTNAFNWQNPPRKIPGVDALDLVDGKVYVHVEAWYDAELVTPFQTAISWSFPDGIYDSYLQFSLQNPDIL